MARPRKTGMDYFPHDTDSVSDEKVEILRALYGNDGYAFFFIILERIYRTENFELRIAEVSASETHQKFVINDSEIIQILSKKLMIDADRFEQMLATCMKHNIFSKAEYESKGVLTSDGIKKRAIPIIDKRSKMMKTYKNKVSASETHQKFVRNSAETPQIKEKNRIAKNKCIPQNPDIEKKCGKDNKIRPLVSDPEVFKFVSDYQTWAEKEFGNLGEPVTDKLLESCSTEIEKLIRIDGFSKKDIFDAIRWGSTDSFWATQVRSLAGLRKKGKNGQTKFKNMLASCKQQELPSRKQAAQTTSTVYGDLQ